MARLFFIGGRSGTGKSTSLRTLNPETSVIINTDKKPLPFEGAETIFSEDRRNYREITTHAELLDTIKFINQNPKITVGIIDTWNRAMIDYTFSKAFRSVADGRKAWAEFGINQYELLQMIPTLRKDLNFYLLCHLETYTNDYGVLMERIAAPGNMVNNLVPESFSTIVLYTDVQAVPGQRPEHFFRTVNSGSDTCKTPMGMFKDIRIPNDLAVVDARIREYYHV